ncbi:MAG: formate dehydrogenase accessory sulfurtransferase FdhD [Chloroflexi bacterium]|nr:formate dehydrogenase accessory sulfurtransferase FdhD [Chloroflexota bacterium]
MSLSPFVPWRLTRIIAGQASTVHGSVVAEEPLEIQLNGEPVAVLMRLPGDEKALAIGFCITEGLIARYADIQLVLHCGSATEGESVSGEDSANRVRIMADRTAPDPAAKLLRTIRSGCGGVEAAEVAADIPAVSSDLHVSPDVLWALPKMMAVFQRSYRAAGGVHAAAVFDSEGHLVMVKEDIGRHNAADKAIGECIIQGVGFQDKIMLITGRASHEMVMKITRVGMPVLVSLSSPTSLALQMAERLNCTIIGYLRGHRMSVYTHPWRVAEPSST